MSRKTSSIAAAGIIAAAVVLSGFSIYKDSHQKNSTDGTITLRMAQTSSQTGAIGQSMDAFADRIYDETGATQQDDGRREVRYSTFIISSNSLPDSRSR